MRNGSNPVYKLIQHPAVEKARKTAEDGMTSFSSALGIATEGKAKFWWSFFGIVFVFTAVILLGSGASSIQTKLDATAGLKVQQQREMLKKRTLMIEDLRLDNKRLEMELKDLKETSALYEGQAHKGKDDFVLLQKILDGKAKLVDELTTQIKELNADLESKDRDISRESERESERAKSLEGLTQSLETCQAANEELTAKNAKYKNLVVQLEAVHKKEKEKYEKLIALEKELNAASKKINADKIKCTADSEEEESLDLESDLDESDE